MNTEELIQFTIETLEAHKAIDIVNLDVRDLTNVCDCMIVCSASSRRHANAMATKLIEAMRARKVRPIGVEGEKPGEWILVDFADVIVHIMLPEIREFYNLEKLWNATQSLREQQKHAS